MNKQKEPILNYSVFNSSLDSSLPSLGKLIILLFLFYSIITFSDEGLITSYSENIILDYNLSTSKFTLLSILSAFGKILCSITLIKLMKKISQSYKFFCIIGIFLKSFILISYYYNYSFNIFLLTRFLSGFVRLYEFTYFISWFSEKLKKPIYGIIITILSMQLGNLFGIYLNYLNFYKSDLWRTNCLLLGIISLLFLFLLMLFSPNTFNVNKNIYYSISKLSQNREINSENPNSPNSSFSNSSGNILNMNTIIEIQKRIEKFETKAILYDLSLEEKLKSISANEFNYYSELKTMILNVKYIISLLSIIFIYFLYTPLLFWFNHYLRTILGINVSKSILLYYSNLSFFGPLIGIALNRIVYLIAGRNKKQKLLSMIVCCILFCIFYVLIQNEDLAKYANILYLLFVISMFYLIPGLLIIHFKYTQYTFKKEDFVLIIILKCLFGDIIGTQIYEILYNYINEDFNYIINFKFAFASIIAITIYFDFNSVEKQNDNIKNDRNKKNNKTEHYRTSITSDIQEEELKEIDTRESIISVDDSDENNNKNKNNEHEYSLDIYIKKENI